MDDDTPRPDSRDRAVEDWLERTQMDPNQPIRDEMREPMERMLPRRPASLSRLQRRTPMTFENPSGFARSRSRNARRRPTRLKVGDLPSNLRRPGPPSVSSSPGLQRDASSSFGNLPSNFGSERIPTVSRSPRRQVPIPSTLDKLPDNPRSERPLSHSNSPSRQTPILSRVSSITDTRSFPCIPTTVSEHPLADVTFPSSRTSFPPSLPLRNNQLPNIFTMSSSLTTSGSPFDSNRPSLGINQLSDRLASPSNRICPPEDSNHPSRNSPSLDTFILPSIRSSTCSTADWNQPTVGDQNPPQSTLAVPYRLKGLGNQSTESNRQEDVRPSIIENIAADGNQVSPLNLGRRHSAPCIFPNVSQSSQLALVGNRTVPLKLEASGGDVSEESTSSEDYERPLEIRSYLARQASSLQETVDMPDNLSRIELPDDDREYCFSLTRRYIDLLPYIPDDELQEEQGFLTRTPSSEPFWSTSATAGDSDMDCEKLNVEYEDLLAARSERIWSSLATAGDSDTDSEKLDVESEYLLAARSERIWSTAATAGDSDVDSEKLDVESEETLAATEPQILSPGQRNTGALPKQPSDFQRKCLQLLQSKSTSRSTKNNRMPRSQQNAQDIQPANAQSQIALPEPSYQFFSPLPPLFPSIQSRLRYSSNAQRHRINLATSPLRCSRMFIGPLSDRFREPRGQYHLSGTSHDQAQGGNFSHSIIPYRRSYPPPPHMPSVSPPLRFPRRASIDFSEHCSDSNSPSPDRPIIRRTIDIYLPREHVSPIQNETSSRYHAGAVIERTTRVFPHRLNELVRTIQSESVLQAQNVPGDQPLDTFIPSGEPSTEMFVEPGTEILMEPGTEILMEPGTEILMEPGTEILMEPSTQVVVEPGTQVVVEPGTQVVVESGTRILLEPGTQIIIEPNSEIGVSTSQTSGEPNNQHSGEPNNQHSGEPNNQTSGEPNNQTSGEPNNQTSGEPNNQTSGEPNNQTSGEPNNQTSGEPNNQTSGEPNNQNIDKPNQTSGVHGSRTFSEHSRQTLSRHSSPTLGGGGSSNTIYGLKREFINRKRPGLLAEYEAVFGKKLSSKLNSSVSKSRSRELNSNLSDTLGSQQSSGSNNQPADATVNQTSSGHPLAQLNDQHSEEPSCQIMCEPRSEHASITQQANLIADYLARPPPSNVFSRSQSAPSSRTQSGPSIQFPNRLSIPVESRGHPQYEHQDNLNGITLHRSTSLPSIESNDQQFVRPSKSTLNSVNQPSGHPQSGTSGHPQSGSSGHPQSGSSGHPQSGSSGHPQSGSSGHPQSGSSCHPQSGSSCHPQSGSSCHPQSGSSGQPQSGSSGQPQSGSSGQPQSGCSGQPQSGCSGQPQTQEQPEKDHDSVFQKGPKSDRRRVLGSPSQRRHGPLIGPRNPSQIRLQGSNLKEHKNETNRGSNSDPQSVPVSGHDQLQKGTVQKCKSSDEPGGPTLVPSSAQFLSNAAEKDSKLVCDSSNQTSGDSNTEFKVETSSQPLVEPSSQQLRGSSSPPMCDPIRRLEYFKQFMKPVVVRQSLLAEYNAIFGKPAFSNARNIRSQSSPSGRSQSSLLPDSGLEPRDQYLSESEPRDRNVSESESRDRYVSEPRDQLQADQSQPQSGPSFQPQSSRSPTHSDQRNPTSNGRKDHTASGHSSSTCHRSLTPSGHSSASTVNRILTPSGHISASTGHIATPSGQRSATPSNQKSATPSGQRSATPSGQRSATPSGQRSATPSGQRSATPSGQRSATPSGQRSATPSGQRSATPSGHRSTAPSGHRSTAPSGHSSTAPSGHSSTAPSGHSSTAPSGHSSTAPSGHRSTAPSGHRSITPSGRKNPTPSGYNRSQNEYSGLPQSGHASQPQSVAASLTSEQGSFVFKQPIGPVRRSNSQSVKQPSQYQTPSQGASRKGSNVSSDQVSQEILKLSSNAQTSNVNTSQKESQTRSQPASQTDTMPTALDLSSGRKLTDKMASSSSVTHSLEDRSPRGNVPQSRHFALLNQCSMRCITPSSGPQSSQFQQSVNNIRPQILGSLQGPPEHHSLFQSSLMYNARASRSHSQQMNDLRPLITQLTLQQRSINIRPRPSPRSYPLQVAPLDFSLPAPQSLPVTRRQLAQTAEHHHMPLAQPVIVQSRVRTPTRRNISLRRRLDRSQSSVEFQPSQSESFNNNTQMVEPESMQIESVDTNMPALKPQSLQSESLDSEMLETQSLQSESLDFMSTDVDMPSLRPDSLQSESIDIMSTDVYSDMPSLKTESLPSESLDNLMSYDEPIPTGMESVDIDVQRDEPMQTQSESCDSKMPSAEPMQTHSDTPSLEPQPLQSESLDNVIPTVEPLMSPGDFVDIKIQRDETLPTQSESFDCDLPTNEPQSLQNESLDNAVTTVKPLLSQSESLGTDIQRDEPQSTQNEALNLEQSSGGARPKLKKKSSKKDSRRRESKSSTSSSISGTERRVLIKITCPECAAKRGITLTKKQMSLYFKNKDTVGKCCCYRCYVFLRPGEVHPMRQISCQELPARPLTLGNFKPEETGESTNELTSQRPVEQEVSSDLSQELPQDNLQSDVSRPSQQHGEGNDFTEEEKQRSLEDSERMTQPIGDETMPDPSAVGVNNGASFGTSISQSVTGSSERPSRQTYPGLLETWESGTLDPGFFTLDVNNVRNMLSDLAKTFDNVHVMEAISEESSGDTDN
ncbi:serine-rich adhesin for platelets [Biomphalaria pfeifferi]|uniref:Serine-rich adhesin for platelets n=1 Tax=Biomphalaria pfeifferi TaxID=112525 RepID=A0AAD8CCB8_BIOPF|nr:serine-rich adhesin for platelets [Biomphalaria pfeifferi]